MTQFNTYREFWPFYVSQHRKLATRFWHAVGTTCVFIDLIVAIVTHTWWSIILAPVVAYAFAWASHFGIEGNRPATFGHPLWSLRGDFQMYFYTLSGRMGNEVRKLQASETNESGSSVGS